MTTPSNLDATQLLAELNKEFGKAQPKERRKKREPTDLDIAKERNKAWHEQNQPLEKLAGGTQRPNPEDSTAWKPEALVTHIVRQFCETCHGTVEYIGGEYVRFRSVQPFGGLIWRRSEHCPNLFAYRRSDDPLPEVFEEHYQTVSRCPGCIAVEKAAVAIWDAFLQDKRLQLPGQQIDLPGFDQAMKEQVK